MTEQEIQNQPTKVVVEELAQKFENFKIPIYLKESFKKGLINTPLNFMKVVLFNTENGVGNEEIDYFLGTPPQRQEGETKDEMKARNKFTKALLKYLPNIYDYSFYPKREKPWKMKTKIIGDLKTSGFNK